MLSEIARELMERHNKKVKEVALIFGPHIAKNSCANAQLDGLMRSNGTLEDKVSKAVSMLCECFEHIGELEEKIKNLKGIKSLSE